VVQLCNLETDLTDSVNVAPKYPELVKELETLMQQAWREPNALP
jgi:hypothetical protein